ncbi:serine hydrolase domain-containing protein [Fibrella aquatilis]|uniref:Serine hydrolase n=1 Tax=Fibrella aquatilis TaxID=2817059 RepID=A0A939K0W2_9BACT|nr:serine hydrolase domain-containing protein [Fibrella aquatilis]MBO0931645.1 serine hydrolase [Fibrella aquatilis]
MKTRTQPYVLLFLSLFACEKQQDLIVDASSKETILKIINAEKGIQNLNALSFAVVKGNQLLWAEALGKATRTKEASIDTRFLIASVSKTVTAVAALKLAENKQLDLDADISTYLPFQVRNPQFSHVPITTRMLLNHSSSISDTGFNSFDFYCWNEDCPTPLSTFFRDIFDPAGQFYRVKKFDNYSPGTKGTYSNMGFALLGYLIERVARQPFDDYCKQQIFVPLGMSKTEWRLKNSPLTELAVTGTPTINSSEDPFTFIDYPNGGIRTTPTDLSKFQRMLMNDGVFNNTQILSKRTVDLMKKYTLTINKFGFNLDFGLGMYYSNIKGKILFGHVGNESGTTTSMQFDPESKIGVIVFTNSDTANLDLIIYSLYKFASEK